MHVDYFFLKIMENPDRNPGCTSD